MDVLTHYLATNPLATGGVMVAVGGALFATLRSLPSRAHGSVTRLFTVTVEVRNNEQLFDWIVQWLDNHPYSEHARLLTASVRDIDADDGVMPTPPPYSGKYRRRVNRLRPISSSPTRKKTIMFSPAPGTHLFWYAGKPVWLERKVDHEVKEYQIREKFVIKTWGRNQQRIRDLLQEVMEFALPPEDKRISIFFQSWNDWSEGLKVLPRPLDSVLLPDGEMAALLAHIRDFLAHRDWYATMGIPYRHGYLLHGVQGGGKSSTVIAVAGELQLPIYVLNFTEAGMDDGKLQSLMMEVPEHAIVLMEDIDTIFAGRANQVKKEGGVSFSGLLNILDGVAAKEGRLVFMTTNHRAVLDPALIRPGRCDMEIEYCGATMAQCIALRHRFFPQSSEAEDRDFLCRLSPDATMADAQKALIAEKAARREEGGRDAEVALPAAAPR